MMTLMALLVTAVLIGIAGIAVSNALLFLRLGRTPSAPGAKQSVSILIPARNEEDVITETLRGLMAQTYPHFNVIVLDDESSDDTAGVARAVLRGDRRFKVLASKPLPAGWIGKNWACHQLSLLTSSDYLIFTDADVRWEPTALAAIMSVMTSTRADGLAVWPTQITESWGERLVVPLMAMTILGYLPSVFVHHLPHDSMCAAIGQCLAFHRDAYGEIGGHAGVRDEILEDVLMMRRIKAKGLRLRTADAAGLISCRMYPNWAAVRDGFAKNILAGHGDSVILLAISAAFHWLIFLVPWVWLLTGWVGLGPPGWPLWSVILVALGVGTRALTAAISGQRPGDAILMPLSILLMTWIAGQALWWHWRYGGPRWKGRGITRGSASDAQ